MRTREQLDLEDARRREEAAEWVIRLREADAGEQEAERWLAWYEADPRNSEAFDRVAEVSALMGRLEPDDLAKAEEAAEAPRSVVSPEPRHSRAVAAVWRGLRAQGPSAALGAACAAAMVFWLGRGEVAAPRVGDRAVVTAASAELVREAGLSDGSKVEIAAQSAVSVRYTASERTLEMRDGAAYFTVAHDDGRPFVVVAGAVRVRALGTKFNVRRARDRVVVTVTEGRVEVSRAWGAQDPGGSAAEAPPAVTLSAGAEVRWGGGDPDPVLLAVKPEAALRWREGRLEYTDEPLPAVLADVNRYSTRRVILGDAALESRRFSGAILTDSIDEWFDALPASLPVRVERKGETVVLSSARRAER